MFSISTKGRYATRAMLELALRGETKSTLLRDISKAQAISVKYLGRIMASMVSAGLVISKRGKNGGFTLACSPAEIRIYDILRAVEGPLTPAPCVEAFRTCGKSDECITREVWVEVKDALTSVLAGITLDDLVRRHRKKNGFSKTNRFISLKAKG
ncbi:MAG TPA: Rrf2 family transcriptional regulator [bacterium]